MPLPSRNVRLPSHSRPNTRSPRRRLLVAGAAITLVVALVAPVAADAAQSVQSLQLAGAPAAAAPAAAAAALPAPGFALGTLGTHPETAAVESAGGVKVAMIEFNWAQDEPSPGVFNAQYEAQMKTRLKALQAAGMRVTLALGLHFAPAWLSAQPGARFVDQHGNVSSQVDLVFNNQVRSLAFGYLAHLNSVIPFTQFWAVRITSGSDAEALYPPGGSYWAFDGAAQNGANMPPSMPRNPLPGWRPGTGGHTKAEVQGWADWYIAALVDAVNWQMAVIKSSGFSGYYQVLTPGIGVTPQVFTALVARNLPDGVLGVGAAWDRFYKMLPAKKNVVAYVSSLADNSGSNSGCAPTDRQVALTSTATAGWSAARWISRIADQYGLLKGGENPGFVASPTFKAWYTNLTRTGMEMTASAQAVSCNFQVMYWAHDDQLWNGVLTLASLLARAGNSKATPGIAPK